MNEENKNLPEINSKMKNYVTAAGICMIIFAVLAVFVTDLGKTDIQQTTLAMPTTLSRQVEAEVRDEPDIRNQVTIIVPATQITETQTTEITPLQEYTTRSAPVSYSLPLGTDMGDDYSRGVPVYNEALADWRTHNGVDFLGAFGDSVRCIADGIVTEIKNDPIMGGIIVVDHGGGIESTYCGVEANENLTEDVFVAENDMLGTLGNIPSESADDFHHLHLEIRVDGELADPLEVMGFDG